MRAKLFECMLLTLAIFAMTGFQGVRAQAIAYATVSAPSYGAVYYPDPDSVWVYGCGIYNFTYTPQAGDPAQIEVVCLMTLNHGGLTTTTSSDVKYPNAFGATINPSTPQTLSATYDFFPGAWTTIASLIVNIDGGAYGAMGSDTVNWSVAQIATLPPGKGG